MIPLRVRRKFNTLYICQFYNLIGSEKRRSVFFTPNRRSHIKIQEAQNLHLRIIECYHRFSIIRFRNYQHLILQRICSRESGPKQMLKHQLRVNCTETLCGSYYYSWESCICIDFAVQKKHPKFCKNCRFSSIGTRSHSIRQLRLF